MECDALNRAAQIIVPIDDVTPSLLNGNDAVIAALSLLNEICQRDDPHSDDVVLSSTLEETTRMKSEFWETSQHNHVSESR